MDRRDLLLTLGLAACGPIHLGCNRNPPTAQPVTSAAPPQLDRRFEGCNIVLISFDALRASHVGCLGNPRPVTPALDAFARQSHSFTRAMSVASWTVPATMSWFTGVYPTEHKLTNKFALYQPPRQQIANLGDLAPHLTTLAEALRRLGYATGGFTGNAGVSDDFGFNIGFDVYYHEKNRFGSFHESVPKALAWLRDNHTRKFFLFLHGYDVHGQSVPNGGYDYRFVDSSYDRKFLGYEAEQETLREEGLEYGRVELRPQDVQFWRAIYDEKIALADARFAKFLTEFAKLDLLSNTLFVVTSDHGTELHEHQRFDHGFTLYDELLHVPLFLRLPGQTVGAAHSGLASSLDVLPTILDLAAVPLTSVIRRQMRGQSLVGMLRGGMEERDIFAETDYRQYTFKRCIITPVGWKLIYTVESRSRELYDLRSDPGETRNLAAARPDHADELERKIFDHYRSLGHDLRAQRWETGLNPVYPSQGKPR